MRDTIKPLSSLQQITEERYKVRVLFEKLNFSFKQYDSFVNHIVDEIIILYYRKHSTKQFIRGKPIRFGLNFGVSHHLKDIPFMQNLSHGADVVLGLIEKYEVKAGSTVTFDNLFTSLPLLDELTELEIDAFGTLQQKHFMVLQ